jgi:hypothetical protein
VRNSAFIPDQLAPTWVRRLIRFRGNQFRF